MRFEICSPTLACGSSRAWTSAPGDRAYSLTRFLLDLGKTVVPIHPRAETVQGNDGFASIADASPVHGLPNVVDVFIRSDRAGEFADDAIDVGAVAVWIPVNVIDADAAQRMMDAGLLMVMDRCRAIDYARLVT
ncbi:MAG: CoA-binding protein [Acidimicrobiales bacterium]|nr:MAG: CoA-binding protein [Acidimicrobiales bacterium]